MARIGGDEFVVVLGKVGTEQSASRLQATEVAEKIRNTLSKSYRIAVNRQGEPGTQIEHSCTVSIGVTLFCGEQESHEVLLNAADAAMYEAKKAGRNQVRLRSLISSVSVE
jgi:diguanylate cyclase (GGDEF)-like protein